VNASIEKMCDKHARITQEEQLKKVISKRPNLRSDFVDLRKVQKNWEDKFFDKKGGRHF